MKKHIIRVAAFIILAISAVAFVALVFFRRIVLKTYMNMAGTENCLPVPTTFALKISSMVSLSIMFVILMFTLGASEYHFKNEHQRFLVQIGSVTVLLLFFALLMWAFALPMYIPDITIAG